MKRLYQVQLPDAVWHFEKKEEVKAVRDSFNEKHKGHAKVALGPDHWKYGLAPASRRTHSHNMRAGGPGTGFKKRAK